MSNGPARRENAGVTARACWTSTVERMLLLSQPVTDSSSAAIRRSMLASSSVLVACQPRSSKAADNSPTTTSISVTRLMLKGTPLRFGEEVMTSRYRLTMGLSPQHSTVLVKQSGR